VSSPASARFFAASKISLICLTTGGSSASQALEKRDAEVKVRRLKALLTERGVFEEPNMKLLIFTEHKDTLDFLVGDGRDGRPLGKLREWSLSATQIHGGMKIGDRDTPGTRIYAEREFRDSCQVLVATEPATRSAPPSSEAEAHPNRGINIAVLEEAEAPTRHAPG
jgi:superfamily II DNA/RNA helicase